MKKLLSLLSILTISGTAVPTTIAASPYQKEEELNRVKRTYTERDINNVFRFRYLGEITDTNFDTIIDAVFRTNGNLPNSLRNRLRILNISGNRVRLGVTPLMQWTPSSSSETYYGETELTFRINRNITHYDEGYSSNNDEHHDEL